MFLGYQNDKIAFIAETKEELENLPCVTLNKIEETDKTYFLYNGEYVCEIPMEEKQKEIRAIRDNYLQETDKFLLQDYPISNEEKENYIKYRKYLRDYTLNDDWYLQKPQTFIEFVESFNIITTNTPILE